MNEKFLNNEVTESADAQKRVNRAEELNRQLFHRENKAATLNAELFSAADGIRESRKNSRYDLSGYASAATDGGFCDGELNRPSPARRAWTVAIACILAAVMGFFGAVVGIWALSASGFSNSNSMLGNLIIDGSGLETHKVVVDETELSYTGGFINVAEKVLPSVVELKELQAADDNGAYSEKGSASGVIISADGYIITNAHVTEGVDKIRVTTSGKKEYIADIIAQDVLTDIAVIKVELPDGDTLTPATFGVSAGVKYGQSVVVVGNPMGIGLSVSTGIVSSPDREITSNGETNNVIQTDAAVSPGNSGGGMFDIYGNLIGIICAKTSGDGIEGLGYAVPVDTAKLVANDLMQYGYVKGRAALGITVASIFDASSYDYYRSGELSGFLFNSRYGVYIVSTMRSTELKRGDRLIKIEGERVTSSGMITEKLKGRKPGDRLLLTVERLTADPDDGNAIETINIEIELFERTW